MTEQEAIFEIKQRRYEDGDKLARWTPGRCADYAGTRYASLKRCKGDAGYGPGKLFCLCHAKLYYLEAA